MTSGLPPIKGNKHQIDFVPRVIISNRPTYRSNLKDKNELQRQVKNFQSKGYDRLKFYTLFYILSSLNYAGLACLVYIFI